MGVLCWLQARSVAEGILATVALMQDSGLPCFGRGQPLPNLRKRFHLDMTEAKAAAFMRSTILDAYDKVCDCTDLDAYDTACDCMQLLQCKCCQCLYAYTSGLAWCFLQVSNTTDMLHLYSLLRLKTIGV